MHCFQKRKVDNKDLCIDLGQVGTPTVPSLRSANVLHQILDVVEIILASKCFKEFQIRTVRALFSFQFFPTFKTSSFIDGISVINPNLKTARMIEKVFSPFFTTFLENTSILFSVVTLQHLECWETNRSWDPRVCVQKLQHCFENISLTVFNDDLFGDGFSHSTQQFTLEDVRTGQENLGVGTNCFALHKKSHVCTTATILICRTLSSNSSPFSFQATKRSLTWK